MAGACTSLRLYKVSQLFYIMASHGDGQGMQLQSTSPFPQVPAGWSMSEETSSAAIAPAAPGSQTQLLPDTQSQEMKDTSMTVVEFDAAYAAPAATADLQNPGTASTDSDGQIVAAGPATPVKKKEQPLGPGELHAIKKFAEAHGMSEDIVTLDMVANSPEKLLHWATQGIDWGSRAANGQAFIKAKKTMASEGDRQIYVALDEPLKREYRQFWDLKRDFSFTKETKIIKMTFEKESIDHGSYRTEEQIAVHLGLAGFPNPCAQRDKILSQAHNYVTRCKIFGGRWLLQNQWLEEVAESTEDAECKTTPDAVEMFLWMDKFVNTTCRNVGSVETIKQRT